MKYQLETIPVWDAIKENCECPFCLLKEKTETKMLDYYLGDSVMEPDVRIRTNKIGFCAQHYSMMLKSDRKLSLALMSTTHMDKITSGLDASLKGLTGGALNSKAKKKAMEKAVDLIKEKSGGCVICDDIRYDVDRYIHTFVYLYKKDPHLKEEIEKSKGFCMEHFADLLKAAHEMLSGKTLDEFLALTIKVQSENMARVNSEVKWFCDKFDYRNADKPWGNSRDSLPRMLTKLGGKMLR